MVSCLLVDQNGIERSRLAKMLGGLGFECAESAGLDAAVTFAQTSKPELILVNASEQTPAHDFLRLVKSGGQQQVQPVVIFYADAPKMEAMGASILAGASDFLIQPFDSRILKFKLQQAGFKLAA